MHTITIEVDDDTLQRIDEVIRSNGWSKNGGLRHLLHMGLYVALADEATRSADGTEKLKGDYAEIGSEYASMRYQLYETAEQNRVLELNIGGYSASIESYKILVEKLRAELRRHRMQEGINHGEPSRPT